MKLALNLDAGLAAHLRALAKGGFVGGMRETAVYLIRSQIIDYLSNDNLRKLIEPHLPAKYRGRGHIYKAVSRRRPA